MFSMQEVAQITKGKLVQGNSTQIISSVHFHSDKIKADGLFIALTGGQRDGHDFLYSAFEHGAVAAIISRQDLDYQAYPDTCNFIYVENTELALQSLAKHYRKRLHIPIIAVTGSNGKTTTKDMIAHLLSKEHRIYKTHKNFNNHLGLPLSLLEIKASHDAGILELGMNHAGEIDFLARMCQPSIGVITNIGESHLEFFPSKQGIAEAKGELLDHIDKEQYVLLNLDDSYVMSQASRYTGRIVHYSTKQQTDIYATQLSFSEEGTSFILHIDDQMANYFIPLFGEHNVQNALPAIYIAYQMGYSLDDIGNQLQSLHISNMRFEILSGMKGCVVINDAYNASPTSMRKAIDTFEHIYPSRKKVLVLGDMFELGTESVALHRSIGHYLKDRPFVVYTIGENASFIAEESDGHHYQNNADLINALQKELSNDHVVLFKASRGMNLENIIEPLLLK